MNFRQRNFGGLFRVAAQATFGTGTFADATLRICFRVQREYLFSRRLGEVQEFGAGSARMSFRAKLFLVFLVTVLASVSVVAYGVVHYTQAAFEEMDAQRTEALVAQFNKEVVQQVENVANGEITLKVAIDLARPNADQSLYVHDAIGVSQDHGLDFVEFVNSDGTLISSAQYPARVGYKNDWVTATPDW